MEDRALLDHLEDLISEEKWLRQQAVERALGTGAPRAEDAAARRLGEVSAQLDRCWEVLLQRAASPDAGAGDHADGMPWPGVTTDRGPLRVQR